MEVHVYNKIIQGFRSTWSKSFKLIWLFLFVGSMYVNVEKIIPNEIHNLRNVTNMFKFGAIWTESLFYITTLLPFKRIRIVLYTIELKAAVGQMDTFP